MLDKIKEYLLSDDIEMVQLGASLMEKNIYKNRWFDILKECSQVNINIPEDANAQEIYGWLSNAIKWNFKIVNNTIQIWGLDDLPKGIWSQLTASNYKHTYNAKNFNLGTLTQAIKKFHTGKLAKPKVARKIISKIKNK